MSAPTSARAASKPPPPRQPVDPRLRERWVTARREEGRRRLRVLVVALSVVGALVIAWGVTISPLLGVEEIQVTGTTRVSPDLVIAASGVSDGDSMVWLDPDDVTARIEASPWILSAHLERDWPRTLLIEVSERTPVAWAQVEGVPGALVVDGTGRVLERVESPPAGLPLLADLTGVAEPGGAVAPVAGARVAAKYGVYASGVRQISATGGGVVVSLVAGPEVRLGSSRQLLAKLRAAGAVLDARRDALPAYVDVSVPTNPVAG